MFIYVKNISDEIVYLSIYEMIKTPVLSIVTLDYN